MQRTEEAKRATVTVPLAFPSSLTVGTLLRRTVSRTGQRIGSGAEQRREEKGRG